MSGAPTAAERAAGWPARLSDVNGLRVRLAREANNAQVSIPPGYEGAIRASSAGWHLLEFRGDACKCCGVKPIISRMSRSAFVVIQPESAR